MLTEDKKKFWSNEDLRSFPLPSDRIAEDQIVARLTHLNVGITYVYAHEMFFYTPPPLDCKARPTLENTGLDGRWYR
ncbi:uncharacterized protein LOC143146616 isoform X1 [Ptiloglossa arizonensis]|uniref:uncharacterized protein LOC143146616 isoform X1 n=1 Tax=Ptiloglossa arizonensis TaxID=3350558 RepID=UPI003F9EF576